MDSVLALHPAGPGSILGIPKNNSILQSLLAALLRTVDRGLIMLIEPI